MGELPRDISAKDPPDWVPPAWLRGRLNRWFSRSPGRVVIWFFAGPPIGAAVTVVSAIHGGWTWVAFAAVTVVATRQSMVYGPRAWRAYRG
jgi:hypothetical protein